MELNSSRTRKSPRLKPVTTKSNRNKIDFSSSDESEVTYDFLKSREMPFEVVMDENLKKSSNNKEESIDGLSMTAEGLNEDPIRTEALNGGFESDELEACRVCLTIGNKLNPIGPYNQDYNRLTRLRSLPYPKHICKYCTKELRNALQFVERSRMAYDMLVTMNKKQLTISNIRKINKNKLQLNLSITHIQESSYIDINFEDNLNKKEDKRKEDTQNIYTDNHEDISKDLEDIADKDAINNDDEIYDAENRESLDRNDEIDSNFQIKSKAKPKVKLKRLIRTKNVKKKDSKDKVKRDENRTEIQRKMDEYFNVTLFKTIEEKIEELKKRKENATYINAPLKCEFCYQGYLDNETYDLHMHKHSQTYGDFVCAVCKYRCPSKDRLRQHIYFRHSRKFNCKLCKFESHDKYRATLHMKFHEGKTYKCKHCDKVFNHLVNLHNHLRAKHPTDNICELCGYSFIGERGLKTHRSLTHGHDLAKIPENAPSCVECNVKFISQEALQTHLSVSSKHGKSVENFKKRNYHQLHRSIKCDLSSEPKVERIMRKRDGIRVGKREIHFTKFDEPVPCEKCGQKIESASEYHYHFKRDHPNEKRWWYPNDSHPHLCDICGKMLRNNALKDHMIEHQDGISFKCTTCGKSFSKKFNMKLHARVHLGERYPCVICGKLFNHMGNRDRHVKYVHTESKNFKCDFCGKCFKNDGARKLHTNHVHLRKPYPKRQRERQIDGAKRKHSDHSVTTYNSECTEMWE